MIMETEITDFRITLRIKTTIRDQEMIIRIASFMMRIEIKIMIKMRMGRRAKWREEPVAKNK